jgi:hypothetical protein
MMRKILYGTIALVFLPAWFGLRAQTNDHAGQVNQNASLEQRIAKLSAALAATQQQVEQSQKELADLRAELAAMSHPGPVPGASASSPLSSPQELPTESASPSTADVAEQQQVMQEEIKQHEQTKVESESKYPVKLSGLIMFSAFSNAGVVDNPDLPTVAFSRPPGTSHGSVGGGVRQSILGIHATGPHLGSASTSAEVSTDFFGGLSYNPYGSTNGSLRLRTADIHISWLNDGLHLGVDGPLISPRSPTSYATLAIPSLGWAGNLWTWSPQVRYERHLPLSDRSSVQLQAGLLDPSIVGYQEESPYRELSAGELARRPALEGRASYHFNLFDRELALGVGAYRARETFGTVNIDPWAITSDWQVPLTRRVELQGEFYRGLGLGALGGGAYKDVIYGVDPITGAKRTLGLNNIGGWGQLKFHLGGLLEANVSAGQDSAYASDMHKLILSPTNPLETMARSRMMVGNLVFRPKTYIIISPEYRRIMNWQITGPANVANIFTLSAGYQF